MKIKYYLVWSCKVYENVHGKNGNALALLLGLLDFQKSISGCFKSWKKNKDSWNITNQNAVLNVDIRFNAGLFTRPFENQQHIFSRAENKRTQYPEYRRPNLLSFPKLFPLCSAYVTACVNSIIYAIFINYWVQIII